MKGRKLVAGTFNFFAFIFPNEKKDKSNLFFRLRFWFLLQFRRCLAWAKWQSGRGKTSPWGVPLKETQIQPSPGQKKWVWHATFVFCGIFLHFNAAISWPSFHPKLWSLILCSPPSRLRDKRTAGIMPGWLELDIVSFVLRFNPNELSMINCFHLGIWTYSLSCVSPQVI